MKRASILLLGMVSFAFAAGMLANPARVQAQGIYLGPGGVSFGNGVGLSFNNGGPYFNRGGYYWPRGYMGRPYDRSGLYWAPGMYWRPNSLWYGDLGWTRFEGVMREPSTTSIPDFSPSQFYPRRDLPPVPQFEELARMNWTHLQRVIEFGSSQLERELGRMATGAKWINYLHAERLQAMTSHEIDSPPSPEETAELEALLKKFDQTADNEQFSMISGLWGFETVHRGVAEFVQNPAVRYRRQLALNSKDLDRSLEQFRTAATWQQYFALPTDVFVDPEDAEAVKSPPDPEALRKALVKFDDVAKNPAYRMIAGLPTFVATHASLAKYLGRDMDDTTSQTTDTDPTNSQAGPALDTAGATEVTPAADPLEPVQSGDVPAETNAAPDGTTPTKLAEELAPPEDDVPTKPAPAVREKE